MSPPPQGPLTLSEAAADLLEATLGHERGLLYTLRLAVSQPLQLAEGYVDERSQAPIRPLRFLIGCIALYSAVVWWLLDRGAAWLGRPLPAKELDQIGLLLQYAGLFAAVVLPCMALIVHLLSGRRVAVIKALALLCYANGTVLLWGAGVVIPSALLGPPWLAVAFGVVGAAYLWAAQQRPARAALARLAARPAGPAAGPAGQRWPALAGAALGVRAAGLKAVGSRPAATYAARSVRMFRTTPRMPV